MQLTYTAVILGSLASLASATVKRELPFPDSVPLHKRQPSGAEYECHADCGMSKGRRNVVKATLILSQATPFLTPTRRATAIATSGRRSSPTASSAPTSMTCGETMVTALLLLPRPVVLVPCLRVLPVALPPVLLLPPLRPLSHP